MSAPTVTVTGPDVPGAAEVLTPEALAFVGELHARFAGRRDELMAADLPHADRAKELFAEVALAEGFVDFLTVPAYRLVG